MNRLLPHLRRTAPWVACLAGLLVARAALAAPLPGPTVETDWLAQNLPNVVVVDVRSDEESFSKKARAGIGGMQACGAGGSASAAAVSGHIPGAIYIPWDQIRADRKVGDLKVVGELPSKSVFERWMTRSGIGKDSAVVVTSLGATPQDASEAARLYWSLKYYGHDNVALLNGGTAKWASEGREVEYGKSRAAKGDFTAGEGRPNLLASTDDVQKATAGGVQLIDVRSQEVYLGLTYHREFVQPHAKGHIPGAKNFPLTLFVNSMGPAATVYSAQQVKDVAALLGVDPSKPTIVYCETGGQAALAWFVLQELVGNKNVRVYDGSMNEWSGDKSRPVVSMKFE